MSENLFKESRLLSLMDFSEKMEKAESLVKTKKFETLELTFKKAHEQVISTFDKLKKIEDDDKMDIFKKFYFEEFRGVKAQVENIIASGDVEKIPEAIASIDDLIKKLNKLPDKEVLTQTEAVKKSKDRIREAHSRNNVFLEKIAPTLAELEKNEKLITKEQNAVFLGYLDAQTIIDEEFYAIHDNISEDNLHISEVQEFKGKVNGLMKGMLTLKDELDETLDYNEGALIGLENDRDEYLKKNKKSLKQLFRLRAYVKPEDLSKIDEALVRHKQVDEKLKTIRVKIEGGYIQTAELPEASDLLQEHKRKLDELIISVEDKSYEAIEQLENLDRLDVKVNEFMYDWSVVVSRLENRMGDLTKDQRVLLKQLDDGIIKLENAWPTIKRNVEYGHNQDEAIKNVKEHIMILSSDCKPLLEVNDIAKDFRRAQTFRLALDPPGKDKLSEKRKKALESILGDGEFAEETRKAYAEMDEDYPGEILSNYIRLLFDKKDFKDLFKQFTAENEDYADVVKEFNSTERNFLHALKSVEIPNANISAGQIDDIREGYSRDYISKKDIEEMQNNDAISEETKEKLEQIIYPNTDNNGFEVVEGDENLFPET